MSWTCTVCDQSYGGATSGEPIVCHRCRVDPGWKDRTDKVSSVIASDTRIRIECQDGPYGATSLELHPDEARNLARVLDELLALRPTTVTAPAPRDVGHAVLMGAGMVSRWRARAATLGSLESARFVNEAATDVAALLTLLVDSPSNRKDAS